MTPKTWCSAAATTASAPAPTIFAARSWPSVDWCRRYGILAEAATMKTIGVDDIAQKLDAVNQGP